MELRFERFTIEREGFTLSLNEDFNERGIYLVAGANGSGKTTFMESALGLLVPASGTVSYDGKEASKLSPSEKKFYFSATFVNENPVQGFTVSDFLNMTTGRNITRAQFESAFPEFAGIFERDITHLSAGQWVSVLIAQNILEESRAVFIDEVMSFLDPHYKAVIAGYLKKASKERAVFIVSHDLDFFSGFADRYLILKKGTVLYKGPAGDYDIKKNIEEIYF